MTINATTPEAIALAQDLLTTARYAALAVTHPDTGHPYVSRTAMLADGPSALMLISTLSIHTKALQADPHCALLIGEPGDKGDPLTHPRMTFSGKVEPTNKAAHKDQWLTAIPKAQLYFDFADFQMYRLTPAVIDLNGGFGKAFQLTLSDLAS
ncbi:MAG: pyridoxamine 5'-phosphate oxidase family protein [Pseudomonadota bacterium]